MGFVFLHHRKFFCKLQFLYKILFPKNKFIKSINYDLLVITCCMFYVCQPHFLNGTKHIFKNKINDRKMHDNYRIIPFFSFNYTVEQFSVTPTHSSRKYIEPVARTTCYNLMLTMFAVYWNQWGQTAEFPLLGWRD